jgi:GTP cyclohydrolase I
MSFLVDPALLPDVQGLIDTRHIPIQRVGIRRIRHPLLVTAADGGIVATVGSWTLTVALPAEKKGTHMSRFVALLMQYYRTPMTPQVFRQMAEEMLSRLQAERGDMTVSFPYFVNKSAPVSGVQSLLDYEIQWLARADRETVEFELVVQVPIMSLCPCSKAISEYGAHNQRSRITVAVVGTDEIEMEDMIRLIEDEASCELWGLLKRPDEKYMTEHAYDNPKFVEDLVRDVAARLAARPEILRYRVEAENFESIHNHSAYAMVQG